MFTDAISLALQKLQGAGELGLAKASQAYLKSPFRFLGVPKPQIKAIAKEVNRSCRKPPRRELDAALDKLWASDYHEERTLAIVLAGLYREEFTGEDIGGRFQPWVNGCETWDHLDELCIRIIGPIACKYMKAFVWISEWVHSPKLWVRRASLIAHIPAIRKGTAETGLIERTCTLLVEDKSFFIRKAIGWALRELSEKKPDEAERIILRIGNQASGLTIREAMRKLPLQRRTIILSRIGKDGV